MRQVSPFPFRGGIEERIAAEWIEPGTQHRVVQNGVFAKVGTISKRLGLHALKQTIIGSGAYPTTAKKVLPYKSEVAFTDGLNLFSYQPGSVGWAQRDQVPPCVARRLSVQQDIYSFSDPDVADGGGYRLFAWVANGNVYALLVDSTTNAVVLPTTSLSATGALPKAMILDGVAIVVWEDTGTNVVTSKFVTLATPTSWSGLTALTPAIPGALGWDAAVKTGTTAGNGRFVVAYDPGGGTKITVREFVPNGSSFVASGTVSDAAAGVSGNVTAIGVCCTVGETCWVGYTWLSGGTAHATIAGLNATSYALTVASTDIETNTVPAGYAGMGVCRVDATHVAIIYGPRASGHPSTGVAEFNTGATFTKSAVLTYQVRPQSRPFMVNGRAYCVVVNRDTMFLADLQLDQATALLMPASTIAPRTASSARALSSLAHVAQPSSTTAVAVGGIALGVRNLGASATRSGIVQMSFDFASPGGWIPMELGDAMYLSAGVPSMYDGEQVTEIGLQWYPDTTTAEFSKSTLTTGGALSNQKYTYAFVWEWTNARGERQQSAPSLFVTYDLTASGTQTNQVTFNVPNLTLTRKAGPGRPKSIALVVYRTAFNNSVMSTVLYRVTPDATTSANVMDPTAAVTSITDLGTGAAADGAIITNALLPTTGGVVENDCPPSFTHMCLHKNRLWGIGEDEHTIWYSTEYVPGFTPRFSDVLTFACPDAGKLTAIASMDDCLVIFKRDAIYVVYGDGPAETGAGNDFTVPRRLASDVGCIEPRSLVLTPMGLMFVSPSGIYLLTRSLESQWIGMHVQDEFTAGVDPITSAVMLGDQGLVLFSTTDPTSSVTGEIIVYDYVTEAWGFWAVTTPTTGFAPIVGAANLGGVYTVVSSDAYVMQQAPSTDPKAYFDQAYVAGIATNYWITLAVETAWIKLAGMMGFKRVRSVQVFANSQDAHDVQVQIATDFATSFAQSTTFTADTIAGLVREELEVRVDHARCESIRFMISDAQPGGGETHQPTNGQGPQFIGLSLDWVQRTGKDRIAPAART